jgi:hypothetical protein
VQLFTVWVVLGDGGICGRAKSGFSFPVLTQLLRITLVLRRTRNSAGLRSMIVVGTLPSLGAPSVNVALVFSSFSLLQWFACTHSDAMRCSSVMDSEAPPQATKLSALR